MICVFSFVFMSVYSITSRNNVPISNFGGGFRCKIFTKSIFLYNCNSKTNNCKYLKFSPNVYVSVLNTWLNFQNILTFFDTNFYEICRKRTNLQFLISNNNPHGT
ncbi:Uncharacterized protein FWK35_00001204, partial [Aphis craccivora]